MTKGQEAFRSMVEKVLLFLAEFIKIWEKNKSIAGAVTIIRSEADAIDTNWEIQKFVTKGVGTAKQQTRDKLDNDCFIIFSIIFQFIQFILIPPTKRSVLCYMIPLLPFASAF